MNSTLNMAYMVSEDTDFVPDFSPRAKVAESVKEQRPMTRDEQDEYIVEHFGFEGQDSISAHTGVPKGSMTGRISRLKETGRIPADRQSLGRQGWRDTPEEPEQKAAEPKHECPPHHRICGDNDILALWPNFYSTHERPAPGVELQVCKYCGDVKAVESYKPIAVDARIERNIAGMREQRAIAEAREHEYTPIAANRNSYNPYLGIRPREDRAVAEIAPPSGTHYVDVEGVPLLMSDGPPVEYDGDAGDEHHDRPEQLHYVDIPQEIGASLLEAEESGLQTCRVCGCTDENGCDVPGGCYWVEDDLCSACVTDLVMVAEPVEEATTISISISELLAAEGVAASEPFNLSEIAEETDTSLTPLGIAHQEIARLRSDLARTEGELRGAYDHTRLLTSRLEQTEKDLHQARMQLLLPELRKHREELRQALADVNGEIEEIESELVA